jgi:hypothetical protein
MLPLLAVLPAVLPAYLAAALLWTFGAVLAFTYSPLALPLIEPLLAGMVSPGATTGFRFWSPTRTGASCAGASRFISRPA